MYEKKLSPEKDVQTVMNGTVSVAQYEARSWRMGEK